MMNTEYLEANEQCAFTEQSPCVIAAKMSIDLMKSDREKVDTLINLVKHRMYYDHIKAIQYAQAGVMYNADIDGCWQKRLGICLDFAGIFAAMCRSNGIPCKIVTGRVTSGGYTINHAWNEVLIDDGKWYRVDMTAVVTRSKVSEYRKKNEF